MKFLYKNSIFRISRPLSIAFIPDFFLFIIIDPFLGACFVVISESLFLKFNKVPVRTGLVPVSISHFCLQIQHSTGLEPVSGIPVLPSNSTKNWFRTGFRYLRSALKFNKEPV